MTNEELDAIEASAAKSIGRVTDVKAIRALVAEVRRLKKYLSASHNIIMQMAEGKSSLDEIDRRLKELGIK